MNPRFRTPFYMIHFSSILITLLLARSARSAAILRSYYGKLVLNFLFSSRHVGAAEGHLDVVKFLLLQPGIHVNARDSNDYTPLLGECGFSS